MPDSFAETPEGILLEANGIQPWLRWDGLTAQAEPAGVLAPATACVLGSSGVGAIVGTYSAYVRFVDGYGNLSNLSPLSNSYVPSSLTGTITNVTSATPMVVTSPGHGLVTGAVVKITGAGGVFTANATWTVTVLDPNTFSLNGSFGSGSYTGGGTWTAGVAQIVYSQVPLPTETKVVRRQILRNTDGQTRVYYVDVDTTDLQSTTLTSSLSDSLLSARTAVPLLNADGSQAANRFGVPPAHKAVVVHHLGRMFAAVEVPYAEGSVAVVQGSATVQGIGTEWPASLAGRELTVGSAGRPYGIAAVNAAAQTLTLAAPYLDPSDAYATYTIRAARAERRLVYYSEAGLSEAWPATNALAIQEDGDEITGLMVNGSFLYILERRHIYRFTFQTDPANDGYVFLSTASRGCVNNRCWVSVEDVVYMLDEQGVHGFTGGRDSEPLSLPIQDIFRLNDGQYSLNWAAARYFHAAHFPSQETIRFFVALAGHYLPRHALAYNYRLKRWWIEEYAVAIGHSLTADYRGERMTFLGASARRVLALWTRTLDGPDPAAGTTRGTVTASTLLTATDARANFVPANVVGHPFTIVDGKGKDQTRLVAAATATTLTLTEPWLILPDATSVYQAGGVNWRYRTPWFRFIQDEQENPRRLELIWEPTPTPALLRLQAQYDNVAGLNVWQTGYTSPDHNGVRVDAGSPDLTVDLTKLNGFAQQRLDYKREYNIDGPRFVYVEMRGASGPDPVIIDQLSIDGVQ